MVCFKVNRAVLIQSVRGVMGSGDFEGVGERGQGFTVLHCLSNREIYGF